MANRDGFFHSLLFCCLLDLAIGQISYSIPEEADPGTFVGNLAKDLELDIRDFEARSFGIAPRRNMKKRYLDVNTKTGILFISERIDREELCPNTDTCVIHIEAIVHNPLHLYRVEITVVDINDNAPSFPLETLTLSIAESAIPGARFPLESASDPDVGTNSLKSYTLSTNDFFNVDVQTSSDKVLVLQKSFDREEKERHDFLLTFFFILFFFHLVLDFSISCENETSSFFFFFFFFLLTCLLGYLNRFAICKTGVNED
uniref:Cadherin domain-containing protein n=1 Tax=Erpetoichthys calabaricus TaxID=27687 RepID=A0A8C4SM92_ERPCA